MTRGVERRLQPRIEIRWPVTVLTARTTIEAEIHNVSPSGAFLWCKDVPLLEGSFFIIIKPPERQSISVAGRSVWSTILKSSERGTILGVGVQFTNVTLGDRRFLTQLVKGYNCDKGTS
jgi:Tfp pilus assembly protein PilZ